MNKQKIADKLFNDKQLTGGEIAFLLSYVPDEGEEQGKFSTLAGNKQVPFDHDNDDGFKACGLNREYSDRMSEKVSKTIINAECFSQGVENLEKIILEDPQSFRFILALTARNVEILWQIHAKGIDPFILAKAGVKVDVKKADLNNVRSMISRIVDRDAKDIIIKKIEKLQKKLEDSMKRDTSEEDLKDIFEDLKDLTRRIITEAHIPRKELRSEFNLKDSEIDDLMGKSYE